MVDAAGAVTVANEKAENAEPVLARAEPYLMPICKRMQRDRRNGVDSGLQLEVIESETEHHRMQIAVVVDQRVRLADGKVIGDTFRDGHPDRFSLPKQWRVTAKDSCRCGWGSDVHSSTRFGLGSRGRAKIPPNAVIIYDVRLRDVRDPR